jgi:hypothetical protein
MEEAAFGFRGILSLEPTDPLVIFLDSDIFFFNSLFFVRIPRNFEIIHDIRRKLPSEDYRNQDSLKHFMIINDEIALPHIICIIPKAKWKRTKSISAAV